MSLNMCITISSEQGWVSDSQRGISDETMSETSFCQVSDVRNCQYLISHRFMYDIANNMARTTKS